MIIIDQTGSVLFANRQVTELFGYSNSDVVGKPVEQLMPERFRDRHVSHRNNYADAIRARPMGPGLGLIALRKDGSEFPVEISLSPIHDAGHILVAAAIRDVTERIRVEAESNAARDAADRANRAKSRFLAMASHDLRQPLQALALLNGALRRSLSREDTADVLDQQDQAIAAMSRLLNALLDISKLESGAIRADISNFRIATVIEELRSEFSGLAAGKGLQLIIEYTDAAVRSDRALIAQALKNLVSNAIKYTPHGWVRLRAHVHGEFVRMEVGDSGIGIPSDQLNLIFDEFYQVSAPTNASRDGYGLGLSIVQRVVNLLGLRLDVRSEPGAGSTFVLEIPADGADEGKPATGAVRGAPCPTSRGTTRRHLLLVEDDAGVLNATRMFLKAEGFRVTTATTKAEAIARLREESGIELVVSDYHLDRGGNGTEVIGAARDILGSQLKAILVTGDTSSAVRDLQRNEQLPLISKPINSDELLHLIRSLLDGTEKRRESTNLLPSDR
jgi:PAS domain S-box-containing protein